MINAGGRQVEVEEDGQNANVLAELARSLWDHTDGALHPTGHRAAFGFQAERRYTPSAAPSSMPWAPEPIKTEVER